MSVLPTQDSPAYGEDADCKSASCAAARIDAIKSGRGLQYILDEAARILGNPLFLYDTEYKLMAYAENTETDDWLSRELAENGALSEQSLGVLRDEGLIDDFSGVRTAALLLSDKLKYGRLLGKIKSRDGIHAASLMMPAAYRAFDALDPLMFEAVCGLCTREARELADFTDYARQYQQSLLVALLGRRKLDKSMYAARVSSLYEGLRSQLFAAVLELPGNSGLARLTELREQLRKLEPGFKYAVYEGRIVVLMGSDLPELDIKRDLPRLYRFLELRGMRTGVSCGFENVFKLRRYYADALRALRDYI